MTDVMEMTEEYIKALKKERDEWKKKYDELKKEIQTSDTTIGKRLKEWIKMNDTVELCNDYPNHKYYVNKMKQVVKDELHD